MRVFMEKGKLKTETEVFRAFRLNNFKAQKLSDGELQGIFQRVIVEMATRDQPGALPGECEQRRRRGPDLGTGAIQRRQ